MAVSPFKTNREIPKTTYIDTKQNKYIVSKCPSLACFKPLWWASGPHAQTFMQCTFHVPLKASVYNREIITLPYDGVQLALDWKEDNTMLSTCPIIVCLHGLGGDSKSRYLQVFTQECQKRGYRSVIYNRRGHGGMSLLSCSLEKTKEQPKVFPSHINMDDMEYIVDYIKNKYPHAPKFLVGFSCGANLAINYISKFQNHIFAASVSVSNGYDIWNGTNILKKNKMAMFVATQFLLDLLKTNKNDINKLAVSTGCHINVKLASRCRTLQDFESIVVVPSYGFSDLQQYYTECSSHNKLKHVKSPLLCISNIEDPLVPSEVTQYPQNAAKYNENIINVQTQRGGHLGWIEDCRKSPWYMNLIFEYFDAIQYNK